MGNESFSFSRIFLFEKCLVSSEKNPFSILNLFSFLVNFDSLEKGFVVFSAFQSSLEKGWGFLCFPTVVCSLEAVSAPLALA